MTKIEMSPWQHFELSLSTKMKTKTELKLQNYIYKSYIFKSYIIFICFWTFFNITSKV